MDTGEIADSAWMWLNPADVDETDAEHMDADAELLRKISAGEAPPTIRCYNWHGRALTIGRLQNEDAARAQFGDVSIYRRPTGGRAVLHDGDLTIVVAARFDDLPKQRAAGARPVGVVADYDLLVLPGARTLELFGVPTATGNSFSRELRKIRSEDCFASAARCDIVEAGSGSKLLGSAMLRTSDAVLVQMSLRPQSRFDIFGSDFLDSLRDQYTRSLNIGYWTFATRRDRIHA